MFLMIAGVQSTQQSGIKGVPPFSDTLQECLMDRTHCLICVYNLLYLSIMYINTRSESHIAS